MDSSKLVRFGTSYTYFQLFDLNASFETLLHSADCIIHEPISIVDGLLSFCFLSYYISGIYKSDNNRNNSFGELIKIISLLREQEATKMCRHGITANVIAHLSQR